MIITQRVDYVWSSRQDRYILVSKKSINWTKEVALCKGASAAQDNLADSTANFNTTLLNDYSQTFAKNQGILGTLTNTLNPIIAAGPNQFGYSPGQVNTLNSQAIQGTGQQYNSAKQALGAEQAAAGGGNSYLPSGAQAAQQAGLASGAANQASNQLLGIQQAGYQQGYNTYESALGQLGGVAGMYSPTGYAGAATNAGNSAGTMYNQIAQENQAANPFNAILGAVGGAAGAWLGNPAAFAGGSSGTPSEQVVT